MLNETTEMRDRLLTARGEAVLKATELLNLDKALLALDRELATTVTVCTSALVNILVNQSKIMGALEMLLKQNEIGPAHC